MLVLLTAPGPAGLAVVALLAGMALVLVRRRRRRRPAPVRYVPLSVREGGAFARLEWAVRGLREAIALELAPWLGPGPATLGSGYRTVAENERARNPEAPATSRHGEPVDLWPEPWKSGHYGGSE